MISPYFIILKQGNKNYKLICLDIDGTLIDRDSESFLEGVGDALTSLPSQASIALVTNQGGVGLRYWMEKDGFGDPDAFPTTADINEKIKKVKQSIERLLDCNLTVRGYVSFGYQSKKSGRWSPVPENAPECPYEHSWGSTWRKPNPGMIEQAMTDAGVDKADVLMIGDRPEDEQAAEATGVDFLHATDWRAVG